MNKILNLLGLANVAKKIVSGEEFVVEAIRKKKALIVFLALDAGPNTRKKIIDKAKYYKIEVDQSFTSDELSKAIGKQNRKVICLTDNGFYQKIKEIR